MASKEIWSDAKETITTLFRDNTNHRWRKLKQKTVITAPSSARSKDFDVQECCEIQSKLKEGFDHIFEHSHVDTFWEDLEFKLKQTTSIHPLASRKRKNEDHLVTSLIYPTLKRVVDSISIIPGKQTDGLNAQQGAVSSHVIIQDEIKMRHASGHPPAVDATIQISDGETCKVLIPVEVKVDIEEKHLYQIAAYVTKVSTAKELEKKVVIGMIIDKENFQLVFSPYFYLDESGDIPVPVPLPIVYVSPPIMWKIPLTQDPIITSALLVIACTCYYQRDRIKCELKSIDLQVLNVARKLFESRHTIKPIRGDVDIAIDSLLKVSEQQQKEIKGLKEELDELKKQLYLKQNGTQSDSQSSSTSVGDSNTSN